MKEKMNNCIDYNFQGEMAIKNYESVLNIILKALKFNLETR